MVSALGVTAALGGCSGGTAADPGNVTLKLVAADYGDSEANSSQKYWDKLVKAYEKKNPGIKVEVSVYSWNEVDAKVKTDGRRRGGPRHGADRRVRRLRRRRGSSTRSTSCSPYPTQADFVSQLAEAGEVGGSQYGMPFASSTRLLFYNKKLFDEAGLTPAADSWSELAADAAALKSPRRRRPRTRCRSAPRRRRPRP